MARRSDEDINKFDIENVISDENSTAEELQFAINEITKLGMFGQLPVDTARKYLFYISDHPNATRNIVKNIMSPQPRNESTERREKREAFKDAIFSEEPFMLDGKLLPIYDEAKDITYNKPTFKQILSFKLKNIREKIDSGEIEDNVVSKLSTLLRNGDVDGLTSYLNNAIVERNNLIMSGKQNETTTTKLNNVEREIVDIINSKFVNEDMAEIVAKTRDLKFIYELVYNKSIPLDIRKSAANKLSKQNRQHVMEALSSEELSKKPDSVDKDLNQETLDDSDNIADAFYTNIKKVSNDVSIKNSKMWNDLLTDINFDPKTRELKLDFESPNYATHVIKSPPRTMRFDEDFRYEHQSDGSRGTSKFPENQIPLIYDALNSVLHELESDGILKTPYSVNAVFNAKEEDTSEQDGDLMNRSIEYMIGKYPKILKGELVGYDYIESENKVRIEITLQDHMNGVDSDDIKNLIDDLKYVESEDEKEEIQDEINKMEELVKWLFTNESGSWKILKNGNSVRNDVFSDMYDTDEYPNFTNDILKMLNDIQSYLQKVNPENALILELDIEN